MPAADARGGSRMAIRPSRCRPRSHPSGPLSAVARSALGDEVVEHYANMADVELAAYNSTVTDWELRRGFERL